MWVIVWAQFPTEEGQWRNACGASTSISASGIQDTDSPGFNEVKKTHCVLREVCPAGIVAFHLFNRQTENFDVKSSDINKKVYFFLSLVQKKPP